MANHEHLEILKNGVKAWNEWRILNTVRPDLSSADLSRTKLYGFNLREANLNGSNLHNAELYEVKLTGADLSNANLQRADFSKADLFGANLRKSNLFNADLSETDLSGVDLSEASLIGANLGDANLQRADLSKADLRGTNFRECSLHKTILNNCILNRTIFGLTDLGTCLGLDTLKVMGECIIDFQTLINSKNISKDFLFKMGLPETYIEYLPDFYDEKPLRLFPVFISHSSADKEFTGKLYEALIARRVRVWYDEHKLKPGDDILDSIDKGINVYDKMILVCSKSSLDSWWVEEELERIFEKERQYRKEHGKKHRLLIPITIDDEILNSKAPLAKSIRKRSIGKFQGWQDEQQFNKALKDLIAALNADRGDDEPLSFL